MNAESLAQALGGRRSGRTWLACCPAHDDRDPSLAIQDSGDGRVLVRCHAGCGQRDVIAVLRRRGLWGEEARAVVRPLAAVRSNTKEALDRSAVAIRIWEDCRSAAGTVVEMYLASRGLVVPDSADLRFHPGLRHPTQGNWPAMVAPVVDVAGKLVGIHRTFLARVGAGKAPVLPARMSLGPIRSGAVRLAAVAKKIAIGEGIETVLSVMQSTGMPAWAALSTSGVKTLVLPDTVHEVVILADADAPGIAAAREAAARWTREGRVVRIALPGDGCKDFNDMLRLSAVKEEGRAAA